MTYKLQDLTITEWLESLNLLLKLVNQYLLKIWKTLLMLSFNQFIVDLL